MCVIYVYINIWRPWKSQKQRLLRRVLENVVTNSKYQEKVLCLSQDLHLLGANWAEQHGSNRKARRSAVALHVPFYQWDVLPLLDLQPYTVDNSGQHLLQTPSGRLCDTCRWGSCSFEFTSLCIRCIPIVGSTSLIHDLFSIAPWEYAVYPPQALSCLWWYVAKYR